MIKIIDWVKTHKTILVLVVILGGFVFYVVSPRPYTVADTMVAPSRTFGTMQVESGAAGITTPSIGKVFAPTPYQPVPPSDSAVRMVSKDTSLSLKVDNVPTVVDKIEQTTTSLGGYLIDSNVSIPEGASNGSINVRVPSEKRAQALSAFKGFGVKIVSEFVVGQDVTDQFVDNDEKLRILESTKTKFEAILADAKNVTEMLNVQQQLLSLQQQIDSIKGQQKYLEGSTKYSRISVYLSTDELALPYAPDTSWRPGVVFKAAVRSLILNLRSLLTLFIWVGVYIPVLLVVVFLLWAVKRVMLNRN